MHQQLSLSSHTAWRVPASGCWSACRQRVVTWLDELACRSSFVWRVVVLHYFSCRSATSCDLGRPQHCALCLLSVQICVYCSWLHRVPRSPNSRFRKNFQTEGSVLSSVFLVVSLICFVQKNVFESLVYLDVNSCVCASTWKLKAFPELYCLRLVHEYYAV